MSRKLKMSELNRKSVIEFQNAEKFPFVVVLDNVRSLNNVGSAFRTCDAFLIDKIFLCGITGKPPNAEIHKTALGAEDSVKWEYFANTLEAVTFLKNEGYKIIALEQTENSTSLSEYKIEKNEKFALIFGNEVKGVEQEIINFCDECIEIPQFGTKHSLNISVSVGIVLWEMIFQYRNLIFENFV